MANLTTITDLIKDVLHRSGENPTDITGKYYNKSVEYINRARLDILKGKTPTDPDKHVNFRFAVSHPPKNLTLLPKITTGTVSVTNNSTTVTFSTAPNQLGADIDADGWYLYIDGEYDVYRIAAHTAAGTNATLDSVFTGTTAGTASYKLVKLEYDIGSSDILRLISPLRIH
ncbi:MAG: hypothetical protein GY861_08375, partial [bacterium]|nr:hypothetical protein [bacterium]